MCRGRSDKDTCRLDWNDPTGSSFNTSRGTAPDDQDFCAHYQPKLEMTLCFRNTRPPLLIASHLSCLGGARDWPLILNWVQVALQLKPGNQKDPREVSWDKNIPTKFKEETLAEVGYVSKVITPVSRVEINTK